MEFRYKYFQKAGRTGKIVLKIYFKNYSRKIWQQQKISSIFAAAKQKYATQTITY